MNICMICNKTSDSIFKLSKHITNNHKIKIKDYYDMYIKAGNSGKCNYCNSDTFFHGIVNGYSSSCNKCKSAAAKDMRLRLKNNPEKFNAFTNKISQIQHQIWNDRKLNGTSDDISHKISKTIKHRNALMTINERKERYGWHNKLSSNDLTTWKNEVMLFTGYHAWWKTATDDEKSNVIKKRISTIIQVQMELSTSSASDPSNYIKYCRAVQYITEINYQRYKSIIDPHGLRGNDYHLDHKFSIKSGFINKVDTVIIGHYCNLELIPAFNNMSKGAKCSIDLNTLLESINE